MVDGKGNFVPGPRTKFEADKIAQQTECKHPFADLRWGSNKTAMYAKCTKCGAKSVVCWRQMSKEPETLRQNPVTQSLFQNTSGLVLMQKQAQAEWYRVLEPADQ